MRRYWRVFLYEFWGVTPWFAKQYTKKTIWRQYRWLDVPGKFENVLNAPMCHTCSAQFHHERPRPLDPLVWSFLTGTLGIA